MIDFHKDGKGIAFGKASDKANVIEISEKLRLLIKGVIDFYPVGSIYMSVNSTNPSNFFGGTWVAWGSGRVPVGINTGDGDFNTPERTGGQKTLQQHNHSANSTTPSATGSAGGHSHQVRLQGGSAITGNPVLSLGIEAVGRRTERTATRLCRWLAHSHIGVAYTHDKRRRLGE